MRSLDPPLIPEPPPEPAYCPRCELKHTRRPDWLCPRCESPVVTEVPASAAVAAPKVEGFPLGARVAGAIVTLTGGAVGLEVARHLSTIPASARAWPIVIAAALVALGVPLLLKVPVARQAGVALAAVAAIFLAEGLVRDLWPGLVRDPLPGPARQLLRDLIRDHQPRRLLSLLGFAVGCLLLGAGRPRLPRLAIGALLTMPLLALSLVAAW